MARKCTCGCNGPVFSRGLCQRAWKREHGKPLQFVYSTAKPKPRKAIAQVSTKQKKRNKRYSTIRKEWLPDHLVCEAQLPGCTYNTSEVHHMEGREGELLYDTSKWLGCCHNCHEWITEHSAEAIAMGLSIRRNT